MHCIDGQSRSKLFQGYITEGKLSFVTPFQEVSFVMHTCKNKKCTVYCWFMIIPGCLV